MAKDEKDLEVRVGEDIQLEEGAWNFPAFSTPEELTEGTSAASGTHFAPEEQHFFEEAKGFVEKYSLTDFEAEFNLTRMSGRVRLKWGPKEWTVSTHKGKK
jgi:hypothetical protein